MDAQAVIPAADRQDAAGLRPPPEVVPARCVHARIGTASCRRCADACPRQAWHLDGEGLRLRAEDCDGCGLCAAVCPTGAIRREAHPARLDFLGQPAMLAGCDRLETAGAGHLPCLHTLSLADLLAAAGEGRRLWLLAGGDCAACPRGQGRRIEADFAALARAWPPASAPPRWKAIDAAQWAALSRAQDNGHGRRSFFQILGEAAHRPVVEPAAIPAMPAQARLLPWVVRLDDTRCDGCLACVRACPQGVIETLREGDRGLYRLHQERCDGCALCADLCPTGAIQPIAWAPPEPRLLDLPLRHCPSCGMGFHPVAGQTTDRCWVCATGQGNARLRQVMS